MACCCGGGTYCCWDKNPALPLAPGEAKAKTSCQELPCTGMASGDFTLYSAGPYADSSECAAQCGGFNCTSSGCVQAATDGQYRTIQECNLVCCAGGYQMTPGIFTGVSESSNSTSYNSRTAYARGVLKFPANTLLRFVLFYWNGGSSNSESPYCPIRWTAYLANYDATGALLSPRIPLVSITCGDLAQPCTFGGATWTSTPGCGYNGYGTLRANKPASANCIEVEVICPGGLMGWKWFAYCDGNVAP